MSHNIWYLTFFISTNDRYIELATYGSSNVVYLIHVVCELLHESEGLKKKKKKYMQVMKMSHKFDRVCTTKFWRPIKTRPKSGPLVDNLSPKARSYILFFNVVF